MKTEQLKKAASALRAIHGGQALDIIAEDMEREARVAEGHPTIETYHAEMVLANDRALHDERIRVCIVGAASKDNPSVEDVGAADALRDWLRDEIVPTVLDGARYRIQRKIQPSEPVTGASPDTRALAEGYEMFVSSMATLATQGIDFLDMARDVLGDPSESKETYRGAVSVLRALNGLYPNTEEAAGEVPIGALAAKCFEEWGTEDDELLAEILRELEQLGLAGGRYVGGVSKHLFAPTKRGETRND